MHFIYNNFIDKHNFLLMMLVLSSMHYHIKLDTYKGRGGISLDSKLHTSLMIMKPPLKTC